MSQTKQCPFCAETILAAAVVCKHCGRDLPGSPSTAIPAAPAGSTAVKKSNATAVFILFGLILMVGFCALAYNGNSGGSSSSSIADLSAGVTFTGTQIEITNKGSLPWRQVKVELNNPGIFSTGFVYEFDSLGAGETQKVGALLFARPDGTRFNPFEFKPQKVSVTANLPDGRSGLYVGSWK